MKPFRRIVLTLGLVCLTVTPLVGRGDSPRRRPRVQEASVTLTEKGYQPATVRLRRGVPARITFLRQFAVTCATEIILEEYNIRRELPINQPVVVEFTPAKSGTLEYSCSMKMVGGTFRIQ
jgi:plastocyanin domain-containing protein